jgi:ribosomal protein S21
MLAATRVEVRRGKNESTSALIRRFSRRAQGLGLVREMRDRRYFKRYKSKNVEHKRALVTAARRARYNSLVKLGKIDPAARTARRGGRR